jgi:hypothetical protein
LRNTKTKNILNLGSYNNSIYQIIQNIKKNNFLKYKLGVMNGEELAEHRETWREIVEAAMGLNGLKLTSKKKKNKYRSPVAIRNK